LPASEEDLLNRLLRGYAEEVRSASGLTRHLGLAARACDPAGFAAARDAFQAARQRSEAYRLSIEICRRMMEDRADSASRPGWSVVASAAPEPVFAPDLQDAKKSIQINSAA